MKVKYFVYAQSGITIAGLKREGGAYKEAIPEKLGEFNTYAEDYHEQGSTVEIEIDKLTGQQLHDFKSYEWNRVLVRLDSKYVHSNKYEVGQNTLLILNGTELSLAEVNNYYDQFLKEEEKKKFLKATSYINNN